MKQWLLDLFSESPRVSETRVMCMLICITGCYVVIKGVNLPVVDWVGVATLAGSLFTIAMGGKVASKYSENAANKTKSQEIVAEQ